MLPENREPTHPGVMLLEDFINPMELSIDEFADKCGLPSIYIQALVDGNAAIAKDAAITLAKFLNMDAGYWMNLQAQFDAYKESAHKENTIATAAAIHEADAAAMTNAEANPSD